MSGWERLWTWLVKQPVSLNDPILSASDTGGKILERGDCLPARGTAPDEAAEATLRRERILRSLRCLEPREREVIARRFGLFGLPAETLERVGHRFGVSRERVRQVQERALHKLRAELETWLDET